MFVLLSRNGADVKCQGLWLGSTIHNSQLLSSFSSFYSLQNKSKKFWQASLQTRSRGCTYVFLHIPIIPDPNHMATKKKKNPENQGLLLVAQSQHAGSPIAIRGKRRMVSTTIIFIIKLFLFLHYFSEANVRTST